MNKIANVKSGRELIIDALKDKAGTKQDVFRLTQATFANFKKILREVQQEIKREISTHNKRIEVSFRDKGDHECEFRFSGDLLIFSVHTNVFNFETSHFIHKTKYAEEDPSRVYCGMIQVHNFLRDSFRYSRAQDVGYMIGRVFVNKERHFFVEGKRQLGFLYNDFESAVLDEVYIRAIVESFILYAIDFDLLVPPYDNVKEMTVQQKIEQQGMSSIKTGKRLGFRFEADSDRFK